MLLPLAFLTGTELLCSAVAFGLVFGFLLHRGGVTDFDVIVRLFQFRDFTVLKVMMTAIQFGTVIKLINADLTVAVVVVVSIPCMI